MLRVRAKAAEAAEAAAIEVAVAEEAINSSAADLRRGLLLSSSLPSVHHRPSGSNRRFSGHRCSGRKCRDSSHRCRDRCSVRNRRCSVN